MTLVNQLPLTWPLLLFVPFEVERRNYEVQLPALRLNGVLLKNITLRFAEPEESQDLKQLCFFKNEYTLNAYPKL